MPWSYFQEEYSRTAVKKQKKKQLIVDDEIKHGEFNTHRRQEKYLKVASNPV